MWRVAQHTHNKHSVQFLLYLQCWSCAAFGIMLMYSLCSAHYILPTGSACDNSQDALAYACKVAKMSSRDASAFKSCELTTHALLVACKGKNLRLATYNSVINVFDTHAAVVMLAGAQSEVDDEQLG